MKMIFLAAALVVAGTSASVAEKLDKRFGPERERGYRSEREVGRLSNGFKNRDDFRNRDRANFLGIQKPDVVEPTFPRVDLQRPPAITIQR